MDSEMRFTVFTEHKGTTMPTSIDLRSKTVQFRINTRQQTWWFSPRDFSSYRSVAPQPQVWKHKLKSDKNPKETTVSCCCVWHLCSSGSEKLSRLVTQALWLQAERTRTLSSQQARRTAKGSHPALAMAGVWANCYPVTPCAVTITSWPFPVPHPSWPESQPSLSHREEGCNQGKISTADYKVQW